jgi:hypothetical protein
VADQFLSKDGEYWQAWREVIAVESLPALNLFRMTFKAANPTVTVAMRIPYSGNYLRQVVEKLQGGKAPGVCVDEIGRTKQGRPLYVIRLDDPAFPTPLQLQRTWTRPNGDVVRQIEIDGDPVPLASSRKTIVVIAQEHATEHASSHVVQGLIQFLISNKPEAIQARHDTTWLLIPIYDPDGSAESVFDRLTDQFYQHPGNDDCADMTPCEVLLYARYLRAFVNSGRKIASAVTLHNLECNEGPCLLSPFAVWRDRAVVRAFNRQWFTQLRQSEIAVGKDEPEDIGWMNHRLFGWCATKYHALPLAFEVNDRNPATRLSLSQLHELGASLAHNLQTFFASDEGQRYLQTVCQFLREREQRKAEHWKTNPWPRQDPSVFDYLTEGY